MTTLPHRLWLWSAPHGVSLALESDSAGLLRRMRDAIPPYWTPAAPIDDALRFQLRVEEGSSSLRFPDGTSVSAPDPGDLVRFFVPQAKLFAAAAARAHVFVHACAVGVGGAGYLFPGPSHAGKSSLCAALLEAGADFYADDLAMLDDEGRLCPAPEHVLLRSDDGHQSPHAPAHFGAAAGLEPLPLRYAAFVRYASEPSLPLDEIRRAEALTRLLAHTPAARHTPKRTLDVLSQALSGARCFAGIRGEASVFAERLLRVETERELDGD